MNYYKRNGIVITADKAPVILSVDGQILVNGKIVSGEAIPALFGKLEISLQSELFEKWDDATELEYKMYMASVMDYESLAERDIRAAMWALNNADSHELRVGGVYPFDNGDLGGIQTVERKSFIISKTQHGYGEDVPSPIKKSNSFWANWIVSKRLEAPFVYLGDS